MISNRSVATIDRPEFIDIQPYNPLISQCTIKVLYLGKNRNGSFIDKNTAIQMANSLPGTPIVAAWRKDVEDFGDHGHVITIEDGEIKFACKTIPYGFVAPNARVWFQKFVDTDEFGNETEHEYMMTTGYLWTGQFEEVQKAVEEGQPQSMELDEETLDGHWANDAKSGMDFFIINDAVFSKLCILGDDVEPCFEGASVLGGVDNNYTEETEFAHTLYTMIKQLQDIIGTKEGGKNMPEKPEELEATEVVTDFVAGSGKNEEPQKDTKDSEAKKEEKTPSKEAEPATDHAVKDDKQEEEQVAEEEEKKEQTDAKKRKCALEDEEKKDETSEQENDEDKKKPEIDSKKKRECSLDSSVNEVEISASSAFALEQENEKLRAELESLRQFKLSIENEKKDALIAKYHMLSDEDKADVIAHKEEYTLEQIDEKLALIYVRKNVDFSTVDGHQEEEEKMESILSFSLDDSEDAEVVSDIQAAFRAL